MCVPRYRTIPPNSTEPLLRFFIRNGCWNLGLSAAKLEPDLDALRASPGICSQPSASGAVPRATPRSTTEPLAETPDVDCFDELREQAVARQNSGQPNEVRWWQRHHSQMFADG